MNIDAYFTLSEGETIMFHELKLTLKSISRNIIPADPIDESIPEGEGVFINFELHLNGKKKTTNLSLLSEPYESILEQTWKNYKIVIKRVKDFSIKLQIYYNGDVI